MKQIVLFFSFLAITFSAYSADYQLINMGPDFKAYVNKYRASTPEEQWLGWVDFENKYEVYYEAESCSSKEPGCAASRKLRVIKFFKELPKFESAMWDLFDRAGDISQNQIAKFKQAFPDLQEDTPIVFLPSLLRYNGRGLALGNKSALFIGVDMTALSQDDLNSLFSHEFFHVYQFSKIPESEIKKTFYSPLWFEGFATWMSIHLNPGTTDTVALMDDELAKHCAQKSKVRDMALEYITLAPKGRNEPNYSELYGDWFSTPTKNVVPRRGYCLGLQVIREVTKKKPLTDLVNLNEAGFKPLVDAALKTLSQ